MVGYGTVLFGEWVRYCLNLVGPRKVTCFFRDFRTIQGGEGARSSGVRT